MKMCLIYVIVIQIVHFVGQNTECKKTHGSNNIKFSLFFCSFVFYSFNRSFNQQAALQQAIPSSNVSSLQSASYCLVFQFPVSSRFLKTIQQLLASQSSSSRHAYTSLYLSFSNVFQKAVPTQDVTNPISLLPEKSYTN